MSAYKDEWLRIACHYLVAAIAAAVVSAIYEYFSHGVYSIFMVGLAMWPLALGALPTWLAALSGAGEPAPLVRTLLAAGVLTLTLGSLVAGVMEIYGSTSAFTPVYWAVGGAIMLAALVASCLPRQRAD